MAGHALPHFGSGNFHSAGGSVFAAPRVSRAGSCCAVSPDHPPILPGARRREARAGAHALAKYADHAGDDRLCGRRVQRQDLQPGALRCRINPCRQAETTELRGVRHVRRQLTLCCSALATRMNCATSLLTWTRQWNGAANSPRADKATLHLDLGALAVINTLYSQLVCRGPSVSRYARACRCRRQFARSVDFDRGLSNVQILLSVSLLLLFIDV